ncbi:GNAT family N-acetyltransferase [Tepidibacter hydrothermalis]|uniref:GNAT family N-acetyltransferase n=1 Tax=Tepidibacter hydrothermalis TaxID=3036126 RepID=A0ABY8EDQ9_9FIRM|nr:GNAT family N-acetyltransferase [Tepidibacter hydrothermalis]WFD11075.1 GNAT family N-acetyltransferase [Tepidibacter hydrothermalis]
MRKASLNDLDTIMGIIKETVKDMNSSDNYQWDNNYPNKNTFENDINNETLYIKEIDGDIAGFICVDYNEAKEYDELDWSLNEKAAVIHRMAVNPKFRRRGIGTKLINFAKEISIDKNINHIKTDTHSSNDKMDNLFKKCGFNPIGTVKFQGKEDTFICYENILK